MSYAPQTDVGPLTWVKGEIDLALGRAAEALAEAAASTDPAGRLQFAQTHLHQARGALSIVGLDGLAQFSEALDRLLAAQARGEIAIDAESSELARRCVAAIGNYIDELTHGAPDQPLRLAGLYAEIGRARGEDLHPADLFFPDLGLRPPARKAEPPALAAEEEQRQLKALRGRFERGLLRWLRTPADAQGPQDMREAVAGIEARQTSPAVRGLWWASLAFFDGLMDGAPADLPLARKLCTRLDAQMRRLLSGAAPANERVMRELLHYVGTHPATSEHQRLVVETFGLAALLPEAGHAVRDTPIAPILQKLRETLTDAREDWDQFSAGTAAALPRFAQRLTSLSEQAQALGRPPLTRLAAGLEAFAGWLRRDPLKLTAPLAMEVAGALLLGESALDGGLSRAGTMLRVEEAIDRIQAHMAGGLPATPISDAAALEARRQEEQEATAHLARELLTTLAQVEQGLDAYFRNPSRSEILAGVRAPLTQLSGALVLLEDPAPRALVEQAAGTIHAYLEQPGEPDPAGFEALAGRLSALGFYLEALRQGPARLADFLPQADAPATAETAEPAPVEAPALIDALPALEEVLEELPALEELQVLDELQALEAEEPEIEEIAPIPPPSLEAQALMAAPEEAVDAELLAIFIEEAHDVLATMAEQLALSRSNPRDPASLTTVRRGFHTLKGSGRMVGLKDLGEAAWALEQTLNRWLQMEWPPTPALHRLIDGAHRLFAEWVAQLEAGGSSARDASAIVAEAERLRAGDTPVAPAASAAEEAPEAPLAAALPAPPLAEELVWEDDLAAPQPEEAHAAPLDLEADLAELDGFSAARTEAPARVEEIGLDGDLDAFDLGLAEHLPDLPLDLSQSFASPGFALEDLESLEASPAIADPSGAPEGEEEIEPAGAEEMLDASAGMDVAAPAIASTLAVEGVEEPLDGELDSPLLKPISANEPEPFPPSSADVPEIESRAGPQPAEAIADERKAPLADTVQLDGVVVSRPIYDLFLAEARQHLAVLGRELARLHANPTLLPPEPAIRAAHTLAGIAGTAQVEAAQRLARAIEYAQNRLRDSAQPPTPDEADILTAAAAALEAMVAQVAALALPLAVPELEQQLEGIARLPMAQLRLVDPVEEVPRPEPLTIRDAAALAPVPPPLAEPVQPAPVRDDIDEQLLPIFREEAEELLLQIRAALRTWREEPAAADRRASLARLLHTLKGSARMAGAMVLGEFVHQQESRLERARSITGSGPIDEIEAAMDTAEQMLHSLGDPTALEPATAATPAGAEETEGGEAASTLLRLRADLVDRFVNEAGEIGIARTRIEGELRTVRRSLLDLTENVIRLRNQLRELEIQAEVQVHSRSAQAQSHHGEFDPLEMDRYTRLQELTRMMAESVGDVTTVQQTLLKNLDGADAAVNSQARLSRDLQQGLMRVRMVRFDSLADRLYRVVRQSAKDLGKRANLDLRGGTIEIDRGVLEHMTAPLEHLLRNAVAHGIEEPEARQAAGKPEIGEIVLTVSQEGNEIVLDLTDDGAGLDFRRIREKARAQGLLGADEEADEKRLTNLIFVPGFSTAGSVSAVSGRGVGMDVVKAETAAVGGRIDVQSAPDAGTRFRVYLPLTLAVTQALLVRSGNRSYAIPSSMVTQVLELKPHALEKMREDGGTDWMGDRYAYRYLPELLGDADARPEAHKFNWVLLLKAGAQTLALHVDGLRGNQEIVVKNAGPQLARLVGMSGATVLGDGEIVLILNPVALASRKLPASTAAGGVELRRERMCHQPTILVVDDSLTVRKITGRLLEREGYRVVTAKDGVDALEKLLEARPAVILSDIEMPRMDGFDLVRNIRADRRLAGVPIIMITSRLAEKHRRYAMEIGANDYLGKPYQEEELLGLIRGYVEEAVAA